MKYNDSSNCPLCNSANCVPNQYYQNIMPGNWSLNECVDCNVCFLSSIPNTKELMKHYSNDYYGFGEKKFFTPLEWVSFFFRYLRARKMHHLVPAGRILDVGCGNAYMLQFLKKWGHQVDGIELDTLVAARASKNLGQEVFINREKILPNKYHAISFWHSLEHIEDPRVMLGICDQVLMSKGILCIAVPNFGSIQSKLSGHHWLHLDLPRHLIHFSAPKLLDFMKKSGFKVISANHFSLEYNVIDILCYFYSRFGFGSAYPFDIIRNTKRSSTRLVKQVVGFFLLTPLLTLAIPTAMFFSFIRSGSTVVMYFRKG